ncbi:subunits of heterodimeric actin filament capping protein Capz [Testicularia cyperi]|uniref:Subunits of heterodimeric actin filament capping protein Capz n=1 Tax=Testicularia cyperi TaxID=1882483 RepID=A0A317XWG1_9BASI|nr:subunits of heterodimeric actin filament capping protein Capz [Testicularia cyperi]
MSSTRLDKAVSLLLQSPPGQTSQVYHDLRGILLDPEANATDKLTDDQILTAAALALEEYNTQQLITAPITGDKDLGIICQAAHVVSGDESKGVRRYAHPKAGKSFLFDHVKRQVSDLQPLDIHEDAESIRVALQNALQSYVQDHYVDGVSSVFTVSNVPAKIHKPALEIAAQETAKTPAENTASIGDESDAVESKDAPVSEEIGAGGEPEAEHAEISGADDIKDDPVDAVESAEAVEKDAKAAAEETPEPATTATEPEPEPEMEVEKEIKYAIHHVGNRYNLSNFWSGRWRASYVVDLAASTVTSTLSVQVHYFENGNVQLNASKPQTFSLPASSTEAPDALAKSVVQLIEQYENKYQSSLESTYDKLAEGAFKALRRQLPLTRQKIDWDKVLNYRLGEELGRS